MSSGEAHNTLCALKADLLLPLALIHSSVQSLCFRKGCFRKDIELSHGSVKDGSQLQWDSAQGKAEVLQGWLRAGSGLAVLLLPLRSAACPSHTPLTFTQTFYSFFFVLPNDQVPVFPPIQALPHSVIQTPIKTPLATHLKPLLHLGEVKRLKQDGEQAVRKNVIYSAC